MVECYRKSQNYTKKLKVLPKNIDFSACKNEFLTLLDLYFCRMVTDLG